MTQPSVEVHPRQLTLVCRLVAGLVIVVFGVLAVLLPRGAAGGQSFGLSDQIAFFIVGLLLAGGVLVFTRARVRGDATGVRVRNALGERFFPWQVVVAVRLDDGAPWAQLELHDDETVAILALQAGDKAHVVDGVLGLRRLLNASRGQ